MADSECVERIGRGVSEWNAWRAAAPDAPADLGWANLNGLNLDGVSFARCVLKLAFCKGCSFVGADFSRAKLRGINLEGCDLRSAAFREADLEGAHMIGADLTGADLSGANLKLANLDGSVLKDADLTGAGKLRAPQLFNVAVFENVRVSPEILEKVKEKAPGLFG